MAKLSIRIDVSEGVRIGPGKVALLELIAERGSISAGGRAMGMSYRRAWEIVAQLNASFGEAVVEAQPGGRSGGGAQLTPFARDLVKRYRLIEAEAEKAVSAHLRAIEAASKP